MARHPGLIPSSPQITTSNIQHPPLPSAPSSFSPAGRPATTSTSNQSAPASFSPALSWPTPIKPKTLNTSLKTLLSCPGSGEHQGVAAHTAGRSSHGVRAAVGPSAAALAGAAAHPGSHLLPRRAGHGGCRPRQLAGRLCVVLRPGWALQWGPSLRPRCGRLHAAANCCCRAVQTQPGAFTSSFPMGRPVSSRHSPEGLPPAWPCLVHADPTRHAAAAARHQMALLPLPGG